jgi:hypothetical protein
LDVKIPQFMKISALLIWLVGNITVGAQANHCIYAVGWTFHPSQTYDREPQDIQVSAVLWYIIAWNNKFKKIINYSFL